KPAQTPAISPRWLQVMPSTSIQGTDDRETLSELLGSCSQLNLNDNATKSQIHFFNLVRYISM
ncbi:hypothetical protein ACQP3J_32715, partial [Escherichia coli]